MQTGMAASFCSASICICSVETADAWDGQMEQVPGSGGGRGAGELGGGAGVDTGAQRTADARMRQASARLKQRCAMCVCKRASGASVRLQEGR